MVCRYIKGGWTIQDMCRPGALGGNNVTWTFDKCRDVSRKCSTRDEMRRLFDSAYQAALRYGWLNDLFQYHDCSGLLKVRSGTYSLTYLKELTSKFATRGEFIKEFPSAYQTALNRKWMDKLFSKHPNKGYSQQPSGYWTLSRCEKTAKTCIDRDEFLRLYPGAHDASVRNNWLDQIFRNHKSQGYRVLKHNSISFEDCKKIVHLCQKRGEFKKSYIQHYTRALKKGWLDELFKELPNQGFERTPPRSMTLNLALKKAKECTSRSELKAHCWIAYDLLRRSKRLEKLFPKRVRAT